MLPRLLSLLAVLVALAGCASTDPVPAPEPVTHVDEAEPNTGGALFNGN